MNLIILFITLAALSLAATFVSQWTTGVAIKWAVKKDLLDHANDRSSHEVPTPRVGGIGVACGMMIGFIILIISTVRPEYLPEVIQVPYYEGNGIDTVAAIGITAGFLLAFVLGLVDDLKNVPVYIKLVVQLLIACLLPFCGLSLKHFHFPGYPEIIELSPLVGGVISGIWILVVMNAVNFMDGINGLSGKFGQLLSILLLISVFNWNGWEPLLILGPVLYGSLNGFLGYNYPKAQTFLGDCGSQPLGFLLGTMGLIVCTIPNDNPLPFIGVLIIFSVYLYDVLFTIIRRLFSGKNIFKAHREHLYQQFLINNMEDHELTCSFVENNLLFTGIIGVVYIHFFYMPEQMIAHFVGIFVTVFFLISYTLRATAGCKEAADRV